MIRTETNSPRWPGMLLLGAIAYAPWHGALFFGRREKIGIPLPILESLTWPGVCNVLLILLTGLAALRLSLLAYRRVGRWTTAMTVACLPLLLGLISCRELDHLTLVSIQNLGLLAALISVILHREVIRQEIAPIKWAPLALGISLTLAVLLPQVVNAGEADVYWKFFAVERFTGWTGEGTPLAFSSGMIALWSLFSLRRTQTIFMRLAALGGIAFSAYVIHINVHRGSLLAVFAGATLGVLSLSTIRTRTKIVAALLLCGALTALVTQSRGFRLKTNSVIDSSAESIAMFRTRTTTTDFDRIINTNGRAEAFNRLNFEMDSWSKRLFGNGTGFSPRLLRYIEFNSPEPGSDLTRIWIEFGLLGFFVFGAVTLFMFRSLVSSPTSIAFMGLMAAYMLTENVLVTPSFGYIPILMFVLAGAIVEPAAHLKEQKSTAAA